MSRVPAPAVSVPQPGDPLLRAEGLRLQIAARVLVQDLGFSVRPGEFWVILGANGSGKTTLLNALADLRRPQAGRLELLGRERHTWPPGEAACLCGYLPQGGDGLYGLSALQAALLGRHPHRGGRLWETEEDIVLACAALDRVDLAGFAERDIGTLSGGECQRVGVASLLTQDPLLYLLDEPLNHLDLRHQVALMDLLQARTRDHGRAVVATIHDLTLAARYATHAVLMPAPGDADAQALAGPAAEVLQPEALGGAFGHPVRRISHEGVTVFLPA